MFLLSITDLF